MQRVWSCVWFANQVALSPLITVLKPSMQTGGGY
jgi:hypothetical protein